MGKSFLIHSFYCLNCGKQGIPLVRKASTQKGKSHRKKLFCPFCRETVNHMECRSDLEAAEFRINFEKGLFKQEAIDSIIFVEEEKIYD